MEKTNKKSNMTISDDKEYKKESSYRLLFEESKDKIERLEELVKGLEMDLRASELTHAGELRSLREDFRELK